MGSPAEIAEYVVESNAALHEMPCRYRGVEPPRNQGHGAPLDPEWKSPRAALGAGEEIGLTGHDLDPKRDVRILEIDAPGDGPQRVTQDILDVAGRDRDLLARSDSAGPDGELATLHEVGEEVHARGDDLVQTGPGPTLDAGYRLDAEHPGQESGGNGFVPLDIDPVVRSPDLCRKLLGREGITDIVGQASCKPLPRLASLRGEVAAVANQQEPRGGGGPEVDRGAPQG